MKVGCVVMAAGLSSRFGDNKLLQEVAGKPVFQYALEAIPAEHFQSIVIVTNSPLFSDTIKQFHFTEIRNEYPELGVSHTISLGLSALKDCDGVLFCVADQPLLKRTTVSNLITFWQQNPSSIAALSCNGVRGNPCLFPAVFFPELLALEGDRGGSAVIRRHENSLRLLEADPQELLDIDTPQALHQLLC